MTGLTRKRRSFKGANVFITGAASGIGRATAEHAGRLGARLHLTDISAPGLAETVSLIEAAGGRYVDVAVMAPVDKGLGVPLLVSGPHALAAQPLLEALGFADVRVVGDEVGRASAIKMIRSVMIKGIEALSDECAAAAEAAGVLDEVVASLDASEKRAGWADRFAYNRERMAAHGLRRAAEMKEVASTLRGLGVEPVMSEATVRRQHAAGAQGQTRRNNAA